jgi:hypothetical protein
MASATGTPQVTDGTQTPCSFFKNPGLQKHPTTHCSVHMGPGWGLAQVGAQAEPHGMKNSFSLHCDNSGG